MEEPPNAIARLALCRGQNQNQTNMNQTVIAATPATIEQVKQNTYIYAKSHAQAYAQIHSEGMLSSSGPLASRKLFKEGEKLVYEFYRARNKEQKVYVIF